MRTNLIGPPLALAVLAAVLAGCGEDDPADSSSGGSGRLGAEEVEHAEEPQEVEVVVSGGSEGEYTFDADLDGLTAGPVTVTLTNDGSLEHQATLLELNDGETLDSVMAAAAQDPTGTELISRVTGYGGPSAAAPGGSASSTQTLEAGEYLMICVIPGEDGLPHAAHGMVEQFTVAPGGDGGADDGEADDDDGGEADEAADVQLVDFGFSVAGPLRAGEPVTVVNEGEQPHELVVLRAEPGVTEDDIAAAMSQAPGAAAGPPPWVGVGGIAPLAPDRRGSFTMPDESGDYVLVCLVPDIRGDRQRHVAHGMVATVTVD